MHAINSQSCLALSLQSENLHMWPHTTWVVIKQKTKLQPAASLANLWKLGNARHNLALKKLKSEKKKKKRAFSKDNTEYFRRTEIFLSELKVYLVR